ncbi:MAG: Lon protease family protein [Alphaproteobacteria bacterium]
MSARSIPASAAGLPVFDVAMADDAIGTDQAHVFSLSSHARAREALAFGLAMDGHGFNIFVVGEDRSGRMTATLAFLEAAMAEQPRPADWVYLANFHHLHEPLAVPLPAGVGRDLRDAMAALVPALREALAQALARPEFHEQMRAESEQARAAVGHEIGALQAAARADGFAFSQTPQGMMVVALGEDGEARDVSALPEAERESIERRAREWGDRFSKLNREAGRRQAELGERLREITRAAGEAATGGLIDDFVNRFQQYAGLARWLVALRVDIVENLERFAAPGEGDKPLPPDETPERRYAVNLFVDNGEARHPRVVLEADPTYANLFGRIEYRQAAGVLTTDFTQIEPGALARANGGVLVLRADALAANADSWTHLKGALRDGVLRIQEMYRAGSVPVAGAPRPQPIPLDLKVVIVGAPRWYYTFFSLDPDFQSYFKVKAEIDPDMAATPANLGRYAGLIQGYARRAERDGCTQEAIGWLLGLAARWAGERMRVSARFEALADVISEAATLAGRNARILEREHVAAAWAARERRNSRIEERIQQSIADGTVMIDTHGAVVGQINALTVRDIGDHQFGAPSRVTARVSVGRTGVTNIEREAALGGPIQQKGALVLQGYLAGRFARSGPLSFNASITFEQSYGGVEGDSATLAEALAVLSDLAGVPLRQDLAVTGSANQRGQVQAIGGLSDKIEGFFRTCAEATGGLTGTQGVVFPAANERHLILRDEVARAVAEGRFHLWSVATVADAIEVFTGLPAGEADSAGRYPDGTVYARVAAQLAEFDAALVRRAHRID